MWVINSENEFSKSTINTAHKMKFSIKDFFPADLVTFTEEILNGNLHFLCSVNFLKAGFYKFCAIWVGKIPSSFMSLDDN